MIIDKMEDEKKFLEELPDSIRFKLPINFEMLTSEKLSKRFIQGVNDTKYNTSKHLAQKFYKPISRILKNDH